MGLILEQTGGQNFNEPVTLRNAVEYSYMWNRCAKYYDRFDDVHVFDTLRLSEENRKKKK